MSNFQKFKNSISKGNKLILHIDESNDSFSFGYTDSIRNVTYNMKMLEGYQNSAKIENYLKKNDDKIATLFPLGRYIVILEMFCNKTNMKMWFIDFRTEYSAINTNFKDVFSEKIITKFKDIKYEMEEIYTDDNDCILLKTVLEPLKE